MNDANISRHIRWTADASSWQKRYQAWLTAHPVDWDKGGGMLVAIVQDVQSRQVLMQGFMNPESLQQSLRDGRVTFYSRSKQRLWRKGESSGHFLQIRELSLDCDRDSLLILAEPCGPTCHEGSNSCFSTPIAAEIDNSQLQQLGADFGLIRAANTESLGIGWLGALERIIRQRRRAGDGEQSYVKHLFGQGLQRMAQKVGEEGVEVALSAMALHHNREIGRQAIGQEHGETEKLRRELAGEAGDLLFHLTVLLQACDMSLQSAMEVLEQRHRQALETHVTESPQEKSQKKSQDPPKKIQKTLNESQSNPTSKHILFKDAVARLRAKARPNIQKLIPYSSARLQASADELQNSVLLNANENPWAPPGRLASCPEQTWDTTNYNYYPQPQPQDLLQALAALYNINAEQLLVGRGSDEGIDLLIRTFCTEQDSIAICSPSFGMYRNYAEIRGCQIVDIPLKFSELRPQTANKAALFTARLPLAELQSVLEGPAPPKLLFIPSPLAPLGSPIPPSELHDLLKLCTANDVILVLDEAYAEFAEILEPQYQSLLPQLDRHPHLIILRTLSKAYSLAGGRIGSLISAPDLRQLLRAVQSPYPMPGPSSHYVSRLFKDAEARNQMQAHIRTICREQKQLFAFLEDLPYVKKIFHSAANFIMLQFEPQQCPKILEHCRQNGLILRDFNCLLSGGLRISVGNSAQMQQLRRALSCLAESQTLS